MGEPQISRSPGCLGGAEGILRCSNRFLRVFTVLGYELGAKGEAKLATEKQNEGLWAVGAGRTDVRV